VGLGQRPHPDRPVTQQSWQQNGDLKVPVFLVGKGEHGLAWLSIQACAGQSQMCVNSNIRINGTTSAYTDFSVEHSPDKGTPVARPVRKADGSRPETAWLTKRFRLTGA